MKRRAPRAGERRPRRADAGPRLRSPRPAARCRTAASAHRTGRAPPTVVPTIAGACRRCRDASAMRTRVRVPTSATRSPGVHAASDELAQPRAAPDHQVADVAVVDAASVLYGRPRARRSSPGCANADDPAPQDRGRLLPVPAEDERDRFAETERERDRHAPRASATAEYDLSSRRTRLRVSSRTAARIGGPGRASNAVASSRCWRTRAAARRPPGRRRAGRASTSRRRRRRGTSRGRSRRARGTGRCARASRSATRRTRRGLRRAVPGRPRRARCPRTARRSGRRPCRPRAGSRGASSSTTLGPTMPAFDRYASSTRSRTASGSGAASSWQNRRKVAPFDGLEGVVGGRREPGAARRVARTPPHERVRHRGRDPRRRVLGRAVVEDQDRQRRDSPG